MALALADATSTVQLAAPNDSTPLPPALLRVVPSQESWASWINDICESEIGWLAQARELAEMHPGSASAHARLAHAELLGGNERNAATAARNALDRAAADFDGPAVSAALQVSLACGDLEAFDEHAGLLSPQGIWAVLFAQADAMRGDTEGALRKLSDAADPVALSMRGWIWLSLRRYADAVRDFRSALRQMGPAAEMLANLGYAYGALGSLKKAVKATKQASILSPSSETIAFNLVSYFVHSGDHESALQELSRLSTYHGESPGIALVQADVLTAAGMLERALKVLQRARTWNDGSRSQAEIAANISFLEWRIGKLDRSATMTALHRELIRCEYKSVGIARMLASLLSHPTDLPQLEALYQGLAEVNDDEKLLSIQSMIAFLRRDFAAATEFAEAWASAEPFNADAAQMLTFLLADYYGDYRRAAKVGVAALGRVPNSWMLANNVSYTLALDGRIDEAKRFLPPSTVNPYIVATAALIEFLSGNTDRGVSGYERAAALAEASGDDQLARLIRLRAFVLMRGQSLSFEEARSIGDEPEGSDPRITLIWRQADRLGVEWPFKNTGRLAD